MANPSDIITPIIRGTCSWGFHHQNIVIVTLIIKQPNILIGCDYIHFYGCHNNNVQPLKHLD